jgi:hypothetical protein
MISPSVCTANCDTHRAGVAYARSTTCDRVGGPPRCLHGMQTPPVASAVDGRIDAPQLVQATLSIMLTPAQLFFDCVRRDESQLTFVSRGVTDALIVAYPPRSKMVPLIGRSQRLDSTPSSVGLLRPHRRAMDCVSNGRMIGQLGFRKLTLMMIA